MMVMTERFTETISTMTVTDNQTGREYKCEMGIDTDLLELLNMLHEENEQLKKQNTFLTEQLAELSAYIMALGYDVELHFEDGRIIKLNEEVVEDD